MKLIGLKKTLRFKVLLLFSLAVLLPVLITTSIIISISSKSIWSVIEKEQSEVVSRIGDRVHLYIQDTKKLIRTVANRDFSKLDSRQIQQVFVDTMKIMPSFIELTFLDKKGNEKVKVSRSRSSRKLFEYDSFLINRSNMIEFKKALSGEIYISPVMFSGSRIPYILVSCSGRDGVILCKLDLREIWDIISKTKVGKNGYSFIVDKNGLLIAHPATERVISHADFSSLSIVKDFLEGKRNIFRIYKDEKGEKVISFFYSVPAIDWGVFTCLPYREVVEPINKMLWQTIFWAVVFTGTFLFIGLEFAGGLLKPLVQLREAAKKISQGKFDINVVIDSGDEIEDLATTFNNMASALKELEQIRQDLISMIVHDMKSPLSGIIGSIDYLITSGKDVSSQKEILSIMKNSADNLYSLIQNLLDVSKMEDGKLLLKKEEVEISEFIENLSRQFTLACQIENKTFKKNIVDVSKISIDKDLISRVLNNLLYNSLQHTTYGGNIWLNISKRDNYVQFEVGDDGAGIPEEYKTKIFEKFVQVERKRAHLRTGTGLGLTFCKMAVELHGGKIWVESEEKVGSKFFFTIPS
ncbi:MAG: ATP-binding protein [Endomicrobiia bacterium]